MIHNLFGGLGDLANGQAIAYIVISSVFGMVTGVLPGLGGPVVLSIVLALIYHISLTGALCIFLAIQAASFFTSSITAILLNTPMHAESFAVTFDGFPMAQRGEAGRALGISAASTCIGGLVGCAALVGFIQIMNVLPTVFHPPEYVCLIIVALLLVGTLGTDSLSKTLISMGVGITISCVGQDPITGVFRFTFNALGLYSGVSLVALAIGLFAIPQMILLFGVAERVARQDMTGREIGKVDAAEIGDHFGRQVIAGIGETFRHWFVCVRAALIGVICGLIPGIGAFAANFMSYGVAQQMSKKRDQFGSGIAEGIIAPEGSSLAKEAGGLVPLFALGIPGGVGSALFLAALAIKNVHVGYNFTVIYPTLAYEAMWIVAIGGVLGTAMGVFAAPLLARITRIPGPCLVPVIMSLTVIGVYVSGSNFFTVMELLIFALIGLVLRRLRYAIAVLVIALVLGETLETNIHLTQQIFPDWSFLHRPLTDILGLLAIAIAVLKVVQQHHDRRREEAPLKELEGAELAVAADALERRRRPYPLLAMITTIAFLGLGIGIVVYSATSYNLETGIMPVVGGSLSIAGALTRVPGDIAGYLRYRKNRPLGPTSEPLGAPLEPAVVQSPERERSLVMSTIGGATHEGEEMADEDLELLFATGPPTVGARYSAITDKSWGLHGQYTREVVAIGWFIFLIALCWLFDFFVALPAFCLLYSLTATRRTFAGLPARIIFGVCIAAASWGMTIGFFNILHITFTPVINIF